MKRAILICFLSVTIYLPRTKANADTSRHLSTREMPTENNLYNYDSQMGSISIYDFINLSIAVAALISTIILLIKQNKIARVANNIPVGIDLLREFRQSDFKKKSKTALNLLKNTHDFNKLTEEQKSDIDYISHYYDNLGILIHKKIISKELIISFAGGSIENSWKIMKPYIEFQRKNRDDDSYQVAYEYLAKVSSEKRYRISRKQLGLK